jgi:nitrate/nitrite transport system substrate-binding protein
MKEKCVHAHLDGGACSCEAPSNLADSPEAVIAAQVEGSLLAAIFPSAMTRRRLIEAAGASTLLGALAAILPVETLKAIAADAVQAPEKPDLQFGFLPITCATPLIMGAHLGLYQKYGLNVKLNKIGGIALIRDKVLNGELDLSQQVMPVPITVSMGIGSVADATQVLSIQNQHGNSLVLAMKHKDNRDPKNWKGFKFAVPFDTSHQAMLLRYYLAESGLDPDQDVSFRVVPPSEYFSNLRTGNIDGFFGGEPGGQRAVYEGAGFIHLLSREIWPGHPCCAFVARAAWIKEHPNTFIAAQRAVIEASLAVTDMSKRKGVAAVLADPAYLNAPEPVIEQVLMGRYADGLGNVKEAPDRVMFNPFPHPSMAVWLMTQLKRWGMIKGDFDYKKIAEQVMLTTEAGKRMRELGVEVPAAYRKETVMGKMFDAADPEGYIKSFPIRRA